MLDGSVPSLLALCRLHRRLGDEGELVAGIGPLAGGSALDPARVSAAERHAEIFGCDRVVLGGIPAVPSANAAATMRLIGAMHAAIACRCEQLAWPIWSPKMVAAGGQRGGGQRDTWERDTWERDTGQRDTGQQMAGAFRLAADHLDRAVLVERLAMLDLDESAAEPPTIDVSVIDLSATQIAELVVDMDVPVETCWAAGGGSCAEAAFWGPHLRRAGAAESALPRA
jgi:hypothetical protein